MYSKLKTCTLEGLNGNLIYIETDLSRGLPMFNIVGLADISIKEAKERVRTAIKNTGYEFPLARITVNLAPANFKKEGSQLDLGIAIGILAANGIIDENSLEDIIFLGELSLDGRLNPINGVLPMVVSMREMGFKNFVIPWDNRNECGFIENIDIIPVKTLEEVVGYLKDKSSLEVYKRPYEKAGFKNTMEVDFKEIKGQHVLKRAMEIAAAGGHNMLILGPPGSGKTMAARRIPTILPDLSFEESIEVTKIYSVAGLLAKEDLIVKRPFKAPHHTSSLVSFIGGGRNLSPGVVSLCHNGVIFLDELPEFQKNLLEGLRQPLEDGFVTVSRAKGTVVYPADFMLIAGMNPCPCGNYGSSEKECSCTQASIDRYLGKVSGPLLDRIDIHIEVSPVKYEDLHSNNEEESSDLILGRVTKARNIQIDRYRDLGIYTNSQLSGDLVLEYCPLDHDSKKILELAFKKYKFSARSHGKILKIARTIADLDSEDKITSKHILEAIRYRTLDNKYWG